MATVTPLADAFTWPIRVYWEDTDAGQVVYHARYLHFMERARSEWLRHIGIEQDQVQQQHGVVFVVIESQLKWHAPARYNDQLWVSVEAVKVGRASLSFQQRIWRQQENPEKPLLSATVKAAAVASGGGKAARIPMPVYSQFVQGAAQMAAA